MKYLILIIAFVLCSCASNYENEESKAIEDITNDFLIQEHWNKVLGYTFPNVGEKQRQTLIDSAKFQIVFSDTLWAFSDISSRKRFVFDNNRYNRADQALLRKIIAQKQFERLPSREI